MAEGWGEDLPGEEWLPVVGYEGLYSVSNKGRVRSDGRKVVSKIGRRCVFPEKLLKPSFGSNKTNGKPAAMVLNLCANGKQRLRSVHSIVLDAFVGPCPEGMERLHWDDDATNNCLENLRYGTRSENTYDQVRNGGHPQARVTHCKWGHEFTPENTLTRSRPGRVCRTCCIEGARAARARVRERAA